MKLHTDVWLQPNLLQRLIAALKSSCPKHEAPTLQPSLVPDRGVQDRQDKPGKVGKCRCGVDTDWWDKMLPFVLGEAVKLYKYLRTWLSQSHKFDINLNCPLFRAVKTSTCSDDIPSSSSSAIDGYVVNIEWVAAESKQLPKTRSIGKTCEWMGNEWERHLIETKIKPKR